MGSETWLARRPTWVATSASTAGSLMLMFASDQVSRSFCTGGRSQSQSSLPQKPCRAGSAEASSAASSIHSPRLVAVNLCW